jgi:putative PIN family toxin of toxin-antitoxin system
MRVVLDTNVIISAILFDGLPEKLLINALAGSDQLIISTYIVAETIRVLETKFSVSPSNLKLLQQLLNEGEMVHFQPFLGVISDEPDNRIIETAVRGDAEYLVTGDKLLIDLKKYKNTQIVSTKQYLELSQNSNK